MLSTHVLFLYRCQPISSFSIVVNPSPHSLSLSTHHLILLLCKLHRYHIRRYQSSSSYISFPCLFELHLYIDGILYSPLANYLYVQCPPIPYLQFRTFNSVPLMHRPIYPPMHHPMHYPMHRPMHHLMHAQILTRWAPRLAQENCPTQCRLYLARLHYGITELTSYPVYMAALVFSCI